MGHLVGDGGSGSPSTGLNGHGEGWSARVVDVVAGASSSGKQALNMAQVSLELGEIMDSQVLSIPIMVSRRCRVLSRSCPWCSCFSSCCSRRRSSRLVRSWLREGRGWGDGLVAGVCGGGDEVGGVGSEAPR